jgi:hypothetical protein
MKSEMIRVVQRAPILKLMPAELDEMTTGEFLEILQWWAKLSSAERQAVLASRKHTRH